MMYISLLDWAVCVIGLVTALYWYLTWHYGYWKSRGVYTPPGVLPGVGHMWEAFTFKKCAQWFCNDVYNQAKGHPAVGLYDFRQPTLLVRDLALVQAVLVSDFSSFHDNIFVVDERIEPYVAKNPFMLRGQKWKALRHKLSPALSPVRVKNMFPMMLKVCQEFNNHMEKHLNEEINVNHITGLFTSEVVAKCAFAVEGNAFNDPNAEFYQQGRKFWEGSFYSPLFMFLLQYFPIINKILKKSIIPKEVIAFFRDLIHQAADYREKNPDKVSEDYLQYLLSLSKKDPEFILDDVVAQSLTFFTDGFETTSIVASFLLYELTVNPDLQDRLRAELMSVEAFTYDTISSLPLLDRIFNETMRKYSAITLLKQCTQDTVLQVDGFSCNVSKDIQVVIPVYGIHHNPDIYTNPENFDPDRFLPENVKKRHPMTFIAFGAGPRTCIGYRMGTAQVKVLVSNIVSHFRLVKCSKTPEEIKLLKTVFIPVPEQGLWVQFEKL